MLGIWKRIKNDQPILGSGSSDEYNKGAALLHMIRQIVGDTLFKKTLHDLNKTFYHQTVNTSQILECMSRTTGRDLSPLFAQYLTTTQVPVLEYHYDKDRLLYRWINCVPGFNMPVKVNLGSDSDFFITPLTRWQGLSIPDTSPGTLHVNSNFYVTTREGQPE